MAEECAAVQDENIIRRTLQENVFNAILKGCRTQEEIAGNTGLQPSDVAEGIRSLYLAGRISKAREGNDIVFSEGGKTVLPEMDEQDSGQSEDRKILSMMARKLRSCRFHVERNFMAENGLLYPLVAERNGRRNYLMYISSSPEAGLFPRMLDNDCSIRIVASDSKAKLETAKSFNSFIEEAYGSGGLLAFNMEHAFLMITAAQFNKSAGWKKLFL